MIIRGDNNERDCMPYRVISTIDGKRGGILNVAGALYALIGITYSFTPPSRPLDPSFGWLPDNLDATELGWLWTVGGIVMIVISLRSKKYPKVVTVGFGLMVGIPTLWSLIFLSSLLFGNPFGFRGGVAYIALSFISLYISGWPNPLKIQEDSTDAN